MPTEPRGACLPGEEVGQDRRGELGVGRGPQGPSQVSRPQMKSKSLVPPGGE